MLGAYHGRLRLRSAREKFQQCDLSDKGITDGDAKEVQQPIACLDFERCYSSSDPSEKAMRVATLYD